MRLRPAKSRRKQVGRGLFSRPGPANEASDDAKADIQRHVTRQRKQTTYESANLRVENGFLRQTFCDLLDLSFGLLKLLRISGHDCHIRALKEEITAFHLVPPTKTPNSSCTAGDTILPL